MFPRERVFGYVEQLDGEPERALEASPDGAVLVGWSMGGSGALRLALNTGGSWIFGPQIQTVVGSPRRCFFGHPVSIHLVREGPGHSAFVVQIPLPGIHSVAHPHLISSEQVAT